MSNTTIAPAVAATNFAGLQPGILSIVPPAASLILAGYAPGVANSLSGQACKQSVALPGGIYSNTNITTALIVKAGPGILAKIFCTTSGTIKVNDCATQAAAVAGNLICGAAMTAGQVVDLNWPCSYGITVSSVSAGIFSISFT